MAGWCEFYFFSGTDYADCTDFQFNPCWTRNADNYDAAVALLGAGGDKFGIRLWWDVKTDKPAW